MRVRVRTVGQKDRQLDGWTETQNSKIFFFTMLKSVKNAPHNTAYKKNNNIYYLKKYFYTFNSIVRHVQFVNYHVF